MLHRDSCNDHDDNQDDLAFLDDKETMSLDKYVTDTSEYPKRIPGRRFISLGLQTKTLAIFVDFTFEKLQYR